MQSYLIRCSLLLGIVTAATAAAVPAAAEEVDADVDALLDVVKRLEVIIEEPDSHEEMSDEVLTTRDDPDWKPPHERQSSESVEDYAAQPKEEGDNEGRSKEYSQDEDVEYYYDDEEEYDEEIEKKDGRRHTRSTKKTTQRKLDDGYVKVAVWRRYDPPQHQ